MKKPPKDKPVLTKTQEYAIQGMLANNKSVSEIAQFLKKARAIIQSYIEENLKSEPAPDKPATTKVSDKPIRESWQNDAGMIIQTANKKSGVAILTQEASEKGDASRKKVTGKATNRHTKNAIFKINKDK